MTINEDKSHRRDWIFTFLLASENSKEHRLTSALTIRLPHKFV
jgi:hypothetical protein